MGFAGSFIPKLEFPQVIVVNMATARPHMMADMCGATENPNESLSGEGDALEEGDIVEEGVVVLGGEVVFEGEVSARSSSCASSSGIISWSGASSTDWMLTSSDLGQ